MAEHQTAGARDTGPLHSEHAGGRRRGRLVRHVAVWWLVGLVVAGGALFAAARYTDRSSYCTTCHEMRPFYSAWDSGEHASTECVACHVDPGVVARLAHKFVALNEVRAHFAGDVRFPRRTPPQIPSARCRRCHAVLPTTTDSGFPHSVHVTKAECATCHRTTGHAVAASELKAAGIFRATEPATMPPGAFAAVGLGTSNVRGHVTVTCTRCHDLAKTGCARCHTPKHKPRGDCRLCHRAGSGWKFRHPNEGVDCTSCHKRPDRHTEDGDCLSCHDRPGKTWMHAHKGGEACDACHRRPAKHRPGACADCHKAAGTSWAFSHPGSTSNCRSCHSAPAGHYAGNCSQCHHRTGATFAFVHPSAGEHSWRSRPCKKCHPGGGSAVSCTCHGGNPPGD